jgi:malate synthase
VETGVKEGDTFSHELVDRLLREEYAKLLAAGNRDVHDNSKKTTLPIAREIVETYLMDPTKLPWYIDLLNITLGTHDLETAKQRIALLSNSFRKDGTRVTENLDWA